MIYGMMGLDFRTDTAGGTLRFTIYLPSPAPAGYVWFKYSPTKGWTDYSSNAVFNETRDQVTLTLVDGGAGDDDGVANGFIIDPSGLGSPASSAVGASEGGGTGGEMLPAEEVAAAGRWRLLHSNSRLWISDGGTRKNA